jgi:hypothetical protein
MTTTTTSPTLPTEWSRELKTRAERYATGKALRANAPRSSHAEWAPDPERPDPITNLEESNQPTQALADQYHAESQEQDKLQK